MHMTVALKLLINILEIQWFTVQYFCQIYHGYSQKNTYRISTFKRHPLINAALQYTPHLGGKVK